MTQNTRIMIVADTYYSTLWRTHRVLYYMGGHQPARFAVQLHFAAEARDFL